MIENLVVNALESLPAGEGRVTVRTAEAQASEEHRVTITVTDTGAGIPPEHLPRLFERFNQATELPLALVIAPTRELAVLPNTTVSSGVLHRAVEST